jgi:hypothetical protein
MKGMRKELGNKKVILLEGYDMVDQWGFAGKVGGNEGAIRCEGGWGCRNEGMVIGLVVHMA